SDVEPGSLAIERSDDDLVLRTRDGSGSVTVADWYRDGGYLRLQRVDFAADASSLAAAELTRLGTEIDHHYALAPGSGTRAVTDWGGSDTLTLGPGVEPAEVTFSRPGNALRVELASGDALTFQEWFQDRARQVETIVFSDGGQPLDPAQVTASLLTVTGTAAADSLLGGDAYADTLLGLDGNDTLQGGAGDDTLDGGPGDDWIYPGSGNDVVRGGPGDDRINDSDGSDSYHLARGDGWDTIIDSKGSNRLVIAADLPYTLARTSVENGDYLIRFEGLADGVRVVDAPSLNNISTSFRYLFTQDGTPGDDTLTGYGIGNLLNGFDGDDTLLGGGSRDELYGGAGNDLLDGGNESDFYYGGPGDDTLGGAFGSDDFVSASNYYQGGPGNDLLRGTIKADSYFFAPGDGHDTIVEEPYVYYSSVLYSSNDGLRLGAGLTPEDLVVRRSGSDLVLDFGAGDSVTVARWFDSYTRQVDWVRFADGSQLDSAALTALSYIQHGGAGDDTLLGYGGAADTLYGHGGNDTLRGYGGNDLLDGGPGDDLLDGGSGNDRYLVAAGDGHDTLLEAGGSDSVLFAAGIARDAVVIGRADNDLLLGLGSDSSLRVPGFLNQSQRWIERFEFADGSLLPEPATLAAQLVTQNGGALDDLLQGCDGIDVLLGDGGDDTLLGLADADRLEGGSGDDLLAGGPGADLLLGGPGNDRYLLQQGDGLDRLLDADGQGRLEFGPGIGLAALTAQVVWTAAGHRLELGYGSGDRVDIDSALDQPAFAFALDGAAPATLPALLVDLAGRDGFLAHSVEGGAFPGGAVVAVHGTALPDHLLGSAGSDNLHGGAGDDWLEGASGQDRLAGGPGDDLLHGGSGVDTYLFGAGDGHDRVQEGSLYEASTVEFTGGVALADVLIQPRAGNLEFQLQPGGETLTYLDWKQGKNSAQLSARFADGSRLEPSQLAGSALLGSDGNDTLRGGRGGERLYGGFGDDRLLGRAGADLLYGGPGDDLLDGGQDGDTYLFSAGWGHDTLAESAGYSGLDEVAFGSGLGPLDLVYARDGSDLLVTRLGGGDSLRLSGWYGSGGPSVEQFRASDGALLGQAAVQGLVEAIAGFAAGANGGWQGLVTQRPDEAQALLAAYWEPAAGTAS
ncbi:MAG TPA: calcium-binding protein, partial [Gammaproteobacteria bacterium]